MSKLLLRSLSLKLKKLIFDLNPSQLLNSRIDVSINDTKIKVFPVIYYNFSPLIIINIPYEEFIKTKTLTYFRSYQNEFKLHNNTYLFQINAIIQLSYTITKLCELILKTLDNNNLNIVELRFIIDQPRITFERNVIFDKNISVMKKFPINFINKKYKIAIINILTSSDNEQLLQLFQTYYVMNKFYKIYYINENIDVSSRLASQDIYQFMYNLNKNGIDKRAKSYHKKMFYLPHYKEFYNFMIADIKYTKNKHNLTDKEQILYKEHTEKMNNYNKRLEDYRRI